MALLNRHWPNWLFKARQSLKLIDQQKRSRDQLLFQLLFNAAKLNQLYFLNFLPKPTRPRMPEPNNKIAEEVAKDIELGLKSIRFVSLELLKALSQVSEQLEAFGVPAEYVSDYICQGYRKVSKWFYELDPSDLTGVI